MRSTRTIIAAWIRTGAVAFACAAAINAMAADLACSPNAEETAGRIKNWMHLQDHFHKYGLGACDDGGLSEAYSERVDKLLTRNWKDISTLAFLVKSDPEFLQFVLRHVDQKWAQGDAAKVAANARKKCPKSASKVCAEIVTTIDALIEPIPDSAESK
ncbi:MAG: hypothetical protein ABI771_08600 [Betaproteobacteria bacterium]